MGYTHLFKTRDCGSVIKSKCVITVCIYFHLTGIRYEFIDFEFNTAFYEGMGSL